MKNQPIYIPISAFYKGSFISITVPSTVLQLAAAIVVLLIEDLYTCPFALCGFNFGAEVADL